MIYPRCME